MIRFLLVLLAFVSALLAFIFQETVLFVASGFLLLVSVVMLFLQVHEQIKRKRRVNVRSEMTPEDEFKARGILAVREKSGSKPAGSSDSPPTQREDTKYAPSPTREAAPNDVTSPAAPRAQTAASEEELREHGILEVRAREPEQRTLFGQSAEDAESPEAPHVPKTPDAPKTPKAPDAPVAQAETARDAEAQARSSDERGDPQADDEAVDSEGTDSAILDPPIQTPLAPQRRRVEVDAHLPALQQTIGAHTACLIDVDTEAFVYRLRSIVSEGAVDDAGSEYPFAGFFLSDLLAETTILDIGGPEGLDIETMGVIRSRNGLKQVVAAPVMQDGMPAAFFVAAFESTVDDSCKEAVTSAAEFFSSLYALQGDEPSASDSPLASATRQPRPLRLVKSNPRSVQRKIIGEEISRARGKAHPLALALVCLDSSTDISKSDETTIHEVEAWMRDCLEAVTPDGRVEYFGELGYGILQSRDVTDVEGWVKRAQMAFAQTDGPVRAHPVVGVAMLSEQHQSPDDLQRDAFKALRAAYECGDSTILVG